MRDKVARLRQLMSEAVPQVNKPLLVFPSNCSGVTETTQLEQTPRSRRMRRILRIAEINQWPQVLEIALDNAQASTLAELGDEDLEALLEQMLHLEDCMQVCADSPLSPPAR